MPSLTRRVSALRESEHFGRLWKYASVSIIATLVTQVVLLVSFDVLHVSTATVCNVIATVVASVPAYYLNRTWTWGKSGKSNVWREVVPFWAVAFVGLVLSTVAVGVAAHNYDRITTSHIGKAIIINFANLSTYGCIWVGRYFIFNKFMFGSPAPALDAHHDEAPSPIPAGLDAGAEVIRPR